MALIKPAFSSFSLQVSSFSWQIAFREVSVSGYTSTYITWSEVRLEMLYCWNCHYQHPQHFPLQSYPQGVLQLADLLLHDEFLLLLIVRLGVLGWGLAGEIQVNCLQIVNLCLTCTASSSWFFVVWSSSLRALFSRRSRLLSDCDSSHSYRQLTSTKKSNWISYLQYVINQFRGLKVEWNRGFSIVVIKTFLSPSSVTAAFSEVTLNGVQMRWKSLYWQFINNLTLQRFNWKVN